MREQESKYYTHLDVATAPVLVLYYFEKSRLPCLCISLYSLIFQLMFPSISEKLDQSKIADHDSRSLD